MAEARGQIRIPISSRINHRLIIGAILVVMVILLGFIGPSIAPRDPLQENFIVFVDDTTFIKPPFAAFMVNGFPLGSDEFGRDILSRLLWGIKPTLVLVIVVAALRLILGGIIGTLAGWLPKKNNFFDTLIYLSGVLPVIFISLCVIAATGQKLGIWAFILGLLLTGWGEVARLASTQTRIIKSQLFIEAAQALGSSGRQILGIHIIPQIIPSLWMLFAFEASQALLVTAELGVLGYFLNAIWIPVGDWVGLKTSGMPELGQMLGDIQKQPWGALSAGFVVFITILGLNLLGEGLRLSFTGRYQTRRQSRISIRIGEWIDDKLFSSNYSIRNSLPVILLIVLLLGLVIGGSSYLSQTQAQEVIKKVPPLPGDNLWAAASRDAQGTYWTPSAFPTNPKENWQVNLGAPISGSPVINYSGIIYGTTLDARLHAIAPDGKELWNVPLPNTPFGSPALTPSGKIAVTDMLGGITLIYPDRKVIEVVKGNSAKTPTISNPISGSDNLIYYSTTTYIFCINAADSIKWKVPLPTYSITSPTLRLTRDNQFLLFDDYIIDANTGSVVKNATPEPLDRYVIGSNNGLFLFTQASMFDIDPNDSFAESRQVKWDARGLGTGFRYPNNSGVSPDGKIWLLYASPYDFIKLIWLESSGVTLNVVDYPFRGIGNPLIAIDKNNATLLCGTPINTSGGEPVSECRVHPINSTNISWKIEVSDGIPVGGALVENNLYITTSGGILHAYMENK